MADTSTTPPFPAEEIWARLDPTIPFKGDWCDFRHRQQGEFLHELAKFTPFDIGLSHIGTSEEGRVLHTLRFGRGKRRVLLWARQHGNEPDCSAGLSMALSEICLRSEEPQYAFLLDRLELGVFPMVNPDGVARFTRRSAQGIDLNRDAIAQTGAEARALVAIKNSFNPEFCFNLHDMNPRKSAEGKHLVAIAFQAGPFEKRDIDNDVRLKAKKVCGIMADCVRPHAPQNVARYAADYMHRAFGDSMMRWGVSSILIEAGGWREDQGGDDFVRRLFALALLRGLYAVAAGEDQPATGDAYDRIPFDSYNLFHDIVFEKGKVLNGAGIAPFACDVAVNANRVIGRTNEPIGFLGSIESLGDLEDEIAKERRNLTGRVLMPGFVAVAPQFRFPGEVPSEADVVDFLAAGVTTVACGVGPFESNRARERWLDSIARQSPPIHMIAFERVATFREIRSRHGLSELAGFLVTDLEISPEDLLHFTHLFHPANHSAIESEFAGRMIGVDVFFQGSASPASTHLHLHLTPQSKPEGRTPIRTEELRALVDEFLRSPSQITLSQDSAEEGFEWLPILIGYGGLAHGRRPTRDFLPSILKLYGAGDPGGFVSALNMLTVNNARAFRLGNVGRVEIGQRADLVVFDEKVLEGAKAAEGLVPELVLLNGEVVVDRSAGTLRGGKGSWWLASAPSAR